MLHAINPLSSVLAAVRVRVGALPVLLIESVFTFVSSAVLPNIVSFTVHDTILESTLEVATISPLKCSISAHLIVGPLTSVLAAIGQEVDSFALLDAVLKIAMVVATVAPHLDTLSVLFILRSDFRS